MHQMCTQAEQDVHKFRTFIGRALEGARRTLCPTSAHYRDCCLCDFLLRNINGPRVRKAFCVYISLGNAASNNRKPFLECGFLKTTVRRCREELQNSGIVQTGSQKAHPFSVSRALRSPVWEMER